MPATSRSKPPRDTSIETYKARRDFSRTAEPAPGAAPAAGSQPIFVVQKHDASRLHWDFRLEHDGVLWSWAVPRGPSLDPHDKRLAVHVEDHPLDYADFHGTIPEGQYGAGTVETWDRGTWEPAAGRDPAADMRRGEIKFVLHGKRLHGHFVLVRLKPRERERAENWLLIKEHDEHEAAGVDAAALERSVKPPKPAGRARVWNSKAADDAPPPAAKGDAAPAPGARRGAMPETQAPQLAELAEETPLGKDWVSEVKFDGYRLLAFVVGGTARLVTRNGHDWTNRLPHLAAAVERLGLRDALLDGEMVALDREGKSDFSALQAALSEGRDKALFYYAFDLLHLDGWDLRPARLVDRKAALRGLGDWKGTVRYSDHMEGEQAALHDQACAHKLEGIICKQADAPYRAGRSRAWVKVKCAGREEFVVLGWTPPQGHRTGIGALHLGYHDPQGTLHYAGAVGTGFSDTVLAELRKRLDALAGTRPRDLRYEGVAPDRAIAWVRPALVAELRFAGWTGDGRVRHASFLGLREDKAPGEVVRPPPHEAAEPPERQEPPERDETPASSRRRVVTVAKPPTAAQDELLGVRLSHPDKPLWPGITKRDLAEYWASVAPHALPEIAGRPLAIVRCPDGIEHQHFFQKHPSLGFAKQFRAAAADGAPYLVLDDAAGLIAAAQMAAIELHAWGATAADALHPDRLVFDLDPGDGVTMAQMASAARDVRDRLKKLGLASFCRTSGGKGLHVVAPLTPRAGWDEARTWCRAFAELMVAEAPDRYVAAVKKSIRSGKILVDWLRNGLGSTAVASFSPRARPGAGVATRLAWREVTETLDPAAFNLRTVPARLARQKTDPWAGFEAASVPLPRPKAG
jgi:bifunctional non-homologous end joining protein LigD